MTLQEHLRSLDQAGREALAKKVSKAGSVGYLYQLAGGHRQASPELAKKIEEATGGLVTRRELRPDIFDDSLAA